MRCGHDGDDRLSGALFGARTGAVGGTHSTGCRERFRVLCDRETRPPCSRSSLQPCNETCGTRLCGQQSNIRGYPDE
jgi:hypothetical protein